MIKYSLFAVGVGVAAMSAVAVAVPAHAQNASSISTTQSESKSVSFTIPYKHVTGEEGEEKQLLVGNLKNGEYSVKVISSNNGSVRSGSNIIVSSDGASVKVSDVEAEGFKEKTAKGTVAVKNGKVIISAQLGQGGNFSGGALVVLTETVTLRPTQPKPVEVKEPVAEAAAPKVENAKSESAPVEIPKTGANLNVALTMAAGSLGYIGHLVYRRING